jgi:hypothetical protein
MPKNLYTKPLIVAAVLFIAGLSMLITSLWLEVETGDTGYFGVATISFMITLSGVITWILYGKVNRQFRKTLSTPLLHYELSPKATKDVIEKNIKELWSTNTASLVLIVFFCVIFGLFGFVFAEDWGLFAMICLGIAIFMTVAFWIITTYRVRKLRHGSHQVILSAQGVYLLGQYHSWGLKGSWISDLHYTPADDFGDGELRITYSVVTTAGPKDETVMVLVPIEQAPKMPEVLDALKPYQRLIRKNDA